MRQFDVLIVGGGQGGAQTATALRHGGFTGTIAIVGDEPELPYDRPPLSKEYLAGAKPWDSLVFHSAESWAERQVELILGEPVVAVDPVARVVTMQDGARIGYGRLVWATGGAARRLTCAGGTAQGVHTVRNRADVDRMIKELPGASEVVVIGGGYIGLEAAAVLTKLGKSVVLVEASARVLARVAAEPLSRFLESEHRARGVTILLETQVSCIEEQGGRVSGVRLADGTLLPSQMAVVGIGIDPLVAPLVDAGAAGNNGVRVDPHCRTTLPDVYAIGDCAEHRNAWADGAWVRIESVQNANDQAATAARSICGVPEPYAALPWFWSNQYDLRVQTIGLSIGFDEVIVRGDPATRAFTVVYLKDRRILALDCVNMVRDYSHGRVVVGKRVDLDNAAIADVSKPLRSLAS